jgi:two-component system cell cycle response regulator
VESLLAPPSATVPAALMPMNRPTSAIGSATASNVAARPVAPSAPVAASRTPAPVTAPTQTRPTTATTAGSPESATSGAGPSSTARRSVRTGAGELPSFQASRTGVLNGASFTQPPDISQGADVDHILVVDDSDIALKFMRNRLSRFGFSTDLVSSGEEALGRMNTRPYKFVFLDVMMEGLDGYQTCRAIKQRKYSDGKPPVVVMLTSRGGTIDKIRGTLAGCDAYLTKPLNERDLIAVLAKHDRQVARGFQETNFGGANSSGFAPSFK